MALLNLNFKNFIGAEFDAMQTIRKNHFFWLFVCSDPLLTTTLLNFRTDWIHGAKSSL